MSSIVVLVEDLVKIYPGNIVAVDHLSFKVYEGEIYGLIGPNGAGKTTTLRIIATLLKPTRGKVVVDGYDVVKDAGKVRELISYLPEEAGAYRNLTGLEYLEFMAGFYARSKEEREEIVEEAIRISGLGDRIHDRIATYSKGMKRRLLLARTLMVKPRLAILDEPTSGLDVVHAIHVRNIIKDYARRYNITILLSSHNMLEVEYLCDRVGILHKGKLYVEDRPRELLRKYNVSNLEEVFSKLVSSHA